MVGEWSRDELLIALEFYHRCPERMHTDAHAKCKEVAAMLGRTPGALDRIIRNIKYADTGGTGLAHASQKIIDLIKEFHRDRQALLDEAAGVRTTNGWPALDCSD